VTGRPGFALVVSLLLVVVLVALGAAMLALGARETEIAAAMARRAEARAAAESAARLVLATWSTRRYRDLPVGDSAAAAPAPDPTAPPAGIPGTDVSGRVVRLAANLFLVTGEARSGAEGAPASARAGLLVRTFDADALAGEFPAAASAQDSVIVHDGEILGPVVDQAPGLPDPDLFGDSPVIDLASITVSGGTASPRPWYGPDGCQDHPLNWGATSPASACYELLPLVRVIGDVEVAGGEGRGLLLVHGDAHLRGHEFHGLIIAHGRITIDDGTVIHGAVHGRTVELHGGAITYDACALRHALSAGRLDAPLRPGARQWIPLF
jgi:hypothetical protein